MGGGGHNQVEFGPFYGRSIAVIRLTLHACHLLGLLRKRMDTSETACDRIGLFGIKMGNFVLLESLSFRHFRTGFPNRVVSNGKPYVCMLYSYIVTFTDIVLYTRTQRF